MAFDRAFEHVRRARELLRKTGEDEWKVLRVREGRFGPNGWLLFPKKEDVMKALRIPGISLRVDRKHGEITFRGAPILHIRPDAVEVPGKRLDVKPGDVLIYANMGPWGALIHVRGDKVEVHRAPAIGEKGVHAIIEVGEGKHRIWLGNVNVR